MNLPLPNVHSPGPTGPGRVWRLAFVVPRYGEQILGGAETLARRLAEKAVAGRLAEVEVFSTCARDDSDSRHMLPAGTQNLNGVQVHRFQVDGGPHHASYEQLHTRLMLGDRMSLADQYAWIHQGAHSARLYAALAARVARFDFVILIPYLFGTTYYAAAIDPARSILWPCLHDEIYAYLQPTVDLFHNCRGILFNTWPESDLAERLYGARAGGRIVGFGLDAFEADGNRFRQRRHLGEPFILYSGRLEPAKNLPQLLTYFIEYKRRHDGPLKLVLMGQGPVAIPRRADIVPLGFQHGQEKLDTYAAASLLVQPSLNESFSIVLMESWLAGVPVLVNDRCEVTRHHAQQSQGGLTFSSYDEFASVVDICLAAPGLAHRLGANGRAYVLHNYSWPVVLSRFAAALEFWEALPAPKESVPRGQP